jgi:hypothetical protein
VISSFVPLLDLVLLVVAFRDFSLWENHFSPFTEVLGRIWRFVTRKDASQRKVIKREALKPDRGNARMMCDANG